MHFCDGGYVSPECSVFVVKPSDDGTPVIDPLLLSVLLRSDFVYGQIMHLIAGIGRPRINGTELREVMVPLPRPELQIALRTEYLAQQELARELKERASSLNREAEDLVQNAVKSVAASFALGHNSFMSAAAGFSGRSK